MEAERLAEEEKRVAEEKAAAEEATRLIEEERLIAEKAAAEEAASATTAAAAAASAPAEHEEVAEEETDDASDSGLSTEYIEGLSYRELRATCKEHNLPANGKTDELKARLLELCSGSGVAMEDTNESDDDNMESESPSPAKRSAEEQPDDEPNSKKARVAEEIDYSSMTCPQLRALLDSRNIDSSGRKADLIARLETSDAAPPSEEMEEEDEEEVELDWGQMKVVELREHCKARGLDIKGRKSELIARLEEFED